MRSISMLTMFSVLGVAAPALAGGGVTLSNPKDAKKVRKARSGVTISNRGSVAPAVRKTVAPKVIGTPAKPGSVLIRVRNADLKTVVLPMFKKQAGISVRYQGVPRKVTLRLTQPIAWEEALALIAKFTNTHVATDRKKGPVLRDKWGGEIQRDVEFDDLNGQMKDTNRTLRASADRARATKHAAFRRDNPVTTQPENIPVIRLGGGTIIMGPRGGGARPYVAAPRPPVPYRSQPYVGQPYVGQPYVSQARPAQPYVSPNNQARPYVSQNRPAQPYVSPGYRSRPYVGARQEPRRYETRQQR